MGEGQGEGLCLVFCDSPQGCELGPLPDYVLLYVHITFTDSTAVVSVT